LRASFYVLAFFGAAILVLCWTDLNETNRTPSSKIAEQYRAYPGLLGSTRFGHIASAWPSRLVPFTTSLPVPRLSPQFSICRQHARSLYGLDHRRLHAWQLSSRRLANRLPVARILIAGRIVACAGLLFGLILYAAGVVHVLALFGPCLFVGVANGLTQPGANVGAVSVRSTHMGSAAGLTGAITVAGASIMAAIAYAVLTEENARAGLLIVMLVSSVVALGAALFARHLEAAAPRTTWSSKIARSLQPCAHAVVLGVAVHDNQVLLVHQRRGVAEPRGLILRPRSPSLERGGDASGRPTQTR
jgi:DHA1 family bicyclomycin/chloramphenicol resistance-like MFS transporter